MTATPGGAPRPRRICETCGEYEPHACAPLITTSRQRWTGRRIVTITDRPGPTRREPAA